MHITYSPEIDALYIGLNDRAKAKTRQITESVILDFDGEDKLIGIEILEASQSIAEPASIAHEILTESSERPDPEAIRAGRRAMAASRKAKQGEKPKTEP